MRRKYAPHDYASLVAEARRRIPGLAVTADVMVGFPGEDEALFAESHAFMRRSRAGTYKSGPSAASDLLLHYWHGPGGHPVHPASAQ